MKQEINITQPEYLIEDWLGKYEVFSWLEYIVTVPNPIFHHDAQAEWRPECQSKFLGISDRRKRQLFVPAGTSE